MLPADCGFSLTFLLFMGRTITCKLTGEVGPGIKAHIIPRSFYDFGSEHHIPGSLINLKGDTIRISRSPIGEYDANLVTADGEAYFAEGDEYAFECLVKKGQEAEVYLIGGEPACLEIRDYDYRKLKLFFLSLLWRASASSRPLFNRISIGPHEDIVREMILERDPGGSDHYATVIGIHRDTPDYGLPMLQPQPLRDEVLGARYYRFFLGHLVATIKVDDQPLGDAWKDFALSPNLPLRFLILDDMRSSEVYLEVARKLQAAAEPGR